MDECIIIRIIIQFLFKIVDDLLCPRYNKNSKLAYSFKLLYIIL